MGQSYMIYNRLIIVIHLFKACIIVDKLLKVFLFCVLSTYDVYKKKILPCLPHLQYYSQLHQIIKESTHILGNSSSYTDLIFTSQT